MKKQIIRMGIALLLIGCGSSCAEESVPNTPKWKLITGGEFIFGNSNGMENEGPEVGLSVHSFYLSETEITNRQFEIFVQETEYITDAEKNGYGSIYSNEWKITKGANWRHPMGVASSIDTILDYPVVMVSFNDAKAYCKWIGARLPTEVEWEYAAKQGHSVLMRKNIMNVNSLDKNKGSDSYLWTAPVHAFEPDSLGLYHMSGNVWEWCMDSYSYEVHDKWKFNKNDLPKVYLGASFDPLKSEIKDTLRVIKGGSFLCHRSTCEGYIPDSRQSAAQGDAFFHIGFRIAKDTR